MHVSSADDYKSSSSILLRDKVRRPRHEARQKATVSFHVPTRPRARLWGQASDRRTILRGTVRGPACLGRTQPGNRKKTDRAQRGADLLVSDAFSAVLQEQLGLFDDSVHPNWTGHALEKDQWCSRGSRYIFLMWWPHPRSCHLFLYGGKTALYAK